MSEATHDHTKYLRSHAAACIAIADVRDALTDLEPLRDTWNDDDPECGHSTSADWETGAGKLDTRVCVMIDTTAGTALMISSIGDGFDYDERERMEISMSDVSGIVAFVRRHVGAER